MEAIKETLYDTLTHHGVKGQKWGVRRYQNYDGTLTAKGRERYVNVESGMSRFAGMLNDDLVYDSSYSQDSYQERIVESDGTMSLPTDSKYRKQRFRQEYLDDPDSVFDKKMDSINHAYGLENGTEDNCTKCASSMILGRMGYDYDAGRCWGSESSALGWWFNNTESRKFDNLEEAINLKFDNIRPGAFGTVDFRQRDTFNAGHVFNWERNSKGDFALYESQPTNGEKYSGASVKECFDHYLENHPWFDDVKTIQVYDMTYASPNWERMGEDSVVRITDSGYNNTIYDKVSDKKYRGL